MSRYIRAKYAVNGFCKCVSCGSVQSIADTDAGHFIPRARGNAVMFNELNVHPQCQSCNRFNAETAKIQYTVWMQKTYGPEIVPALQKRARDIVRYTVADYLEFERDYTARHKALESTGQSWAAS